MRELFHINNQAIEAEITRANEDKKLLQETLNIFESLNIGTIDNIGELQELLRNPELFCSRLIERMVPEEAKIGELKVSRNKLIEISTPDNFDEVIKKLNRRYAIADHVNWELYAIKGNTIALSDNNIDIVTEKWSTYITNSEQVEFLSFVDNVMKLSEVAKKYKNVIGPFHISCEVIGPHWKSGQLMKFEDNICKALKSIK